MKLELIDNLTCKEESFDTTLKTLRIILRKWKTQAIVVDRDNNVVENNNICYALKILGTKYALVSRQDTGLEISVDVLDPYWEFRENTMNPRIYSNVVELLYRNFPTPLVKLKYLSNKNVKIYAKLEWYNPFSLSIKDRIAWYMLEKAFKQYSEKLKLIYEATSTNTGLALAGLGNFYGIKTRLYLPKTTQKCIDYLFHALGAEVVRKQASITTEMINEVRKEAEKDNAINLNQFENDYNFYVHLRYTAKEIDYQSKITGFIPNILIGGIGTSGHLSAIAFYFKNKYNDKIKVYAVEPEEGHIIPGIRRVETGMKWIHYVVIDKVYRVSLEEAVEGVLKVARSDGLLIGLSSGAVAYVASKLVEEEGLDGNIVLIFPDHGSKYMEIIEGVLSKACMPA